MNDAEVGAMLEEDLLDGRTTFTWGHLLDVVAERWPEAGFSYVERVAEDVAVGPAVVELPGADPATEVEYSTPARLLEVRRRVVDRAADRQDRGLGLAGEDELSSVLVRRPELSPDHVAAVGELGTSGRAIDVLLCCDRADKVAVVEAMGAAWQRWGPRVLAAARTADEAAQLERETGVVSAAVDELLADVEFARAGGGGLPRGFVLLVDDANLLPDHTLTRLLDAAARYDTKVVLVADELRSAPDVAERAFGAIAAAAQPVIVRRPHERGAAGREVAQEAEHLPPYLRGILAARTAERAWLLRRIAREETRLNELQNARAALPAWQRAQRRDLADQMIVAQDALGAARFRLAALNRDIDSLKPDERIHPPTTPPRSDITRNVNRPHHVRDGVTSDERRNQREAESRDHGRGGR